MSILRTTLLAAVGAAVGAGVVYYMTQKDTEEFQSKLDNLNDVTKEGCDAVRDWFAADEQVNTTDSV